MIGGQKPAWTEPIPKTAGFRSTDTDQQQAPAAPEQRDTADRMDQLRKQDPATVELGLLGNSTSSIRK
jgi:hypothetical protein